MTGRIEHEPERGGFRILIDDKCSEWQPYTGIARLDIGRKSYFAVSPYYDGVFPAGVILEFSQADLEGRLSAAEAKVILQKAIDDTKENA